MTMQPPSTASASRIQFVLAFAAIYVLWSSTFLAIRYAVAEMPPLLTIAMRCAGGAAILLLWQAARGRLTRPTFPQLRTAFIAGAVLFVGGHGLLAWAEQRVTSGQAALWMTTTPLWLVAIGAWSERRIPAPKLLVAVTLGMVGVGALVLGQPGVQTAQEGIANSRDGIGLERLALAGSAMFWAVGSLIGRNGARPASALDSTALQLAGGALVVFLLSVTTGELADWNPDRITARGAGSLAFLIFGGTVLGFGAYTWLLTVTTPVAAGTYAFVNPVLALALAWAVGDESFSPLTVVAAVLVIGAVALTHGSHGSHAGQSGARSGPVPAFPSAPARLASDRSRRAS